MSTLSLSEENLQHLAESRLLRCQTETSNRKAANGCIYYCYLQTRWQQALERIADGFVHHVRQTKQKAKDYAQEAVFGDWQKTAMSARQLKYCTCSLIARDLQLPFATVRQQALSLLTKRDLESVCLFLEQTATIGR
ncbi:hypothetical protein [Klebsiella pneumoniae]|uniref:hypothetical protein n=1 Tax=Klebsiella pneumoniae TaxID=573 RepID=UPI002948F7ED|nr:hypothetical protein [Klebsiella pneumoniae]MDV5417908.1 hypothetical protein [Klebsiella pneumoniae]